MLCFQSQRLNNCILYNFESRSIFQQSNIHKSLTKLLFFICRNFHLSKMQYLFEIESRTYCNVYRNMYIKVFLLSVEECSFFRHYLLRNIARLYGVKYIFIEFRREDSYRQFFRRISAAFHVFSERVSGRKREGLKMKSSLWQSNHVGLPIIRNRKGRWWGLVT